MGLDRSIRIGSEAMSACYMARRLYVPTSKCVNKVLTSTTHPGTLGRDVAGAGRRAASSVADRLRIGCGSVAGGGRGMRIGLVGVGRIGAFHAATLKGLPAVEQVVLADADPDRAELVAKDLDLEHARDVDALLSRDVDGFVIAAATQAHAELIRKGVAAAVPTFCEKPVAA